MKCSPAFSAISALGLAACGNLTGPISSGGDFDPLRAPGSGNTINLSSGSTFVAGQFVSASMNSTAFFRTRPKGDGDADKLLSRGTSMKVIATSGSYVKVELDTGEVGFVPSVMLEVAGSGTANDFPLDNPGEFQIYPPPGGLADPLPLVDPAGLPPEGSIPPVIDPDAPALDAPLAPSGETLPVPVEEKPVPLPPNGEE
jgi:hypothetical protein